MRVSLRRSRVLAAVGMVIVIAAVSAQASQAAIAMGVTTSGMSSRTTSGSALDAYASLVGRMPAVVMWYQNWSPGQTGPALVSTQAMNIVRARGAVPLVTWEPRLAGSSTCLGAKAIAAGTYDAYLKKAAQEAKNWGFPFFVRPWHELNGKWMCWGVPWTTSAADFVAAWRHVVSVFRANGATNVKFIWNPNCTSINSPDPSNAYPGDAYVDWIALDGYNRDAVYWRSFSDIFTKSYASITRLTTKPLMIAETASLEEGGSKASWITNTFSSTNLSKFPRVRAILWFNFDKEHDWRVNSSTTSLNAYRKAVAQSSTQLTGSQVIGLKN